MAHSAARVPGVHGVKTRPKKGQPFDPDELCRRLEAHIAQENLKSTKRRETKKTTQKNYRHVPQVAAAAFERTTTSEGLRKVHKLSEIAVRTHLKPLNVDEPSNKHTRSRHHNVTGLQKHEALDQAVLERDMLRNRNQFQWNQDMEDAASVDSERDVYKPPQRTFHGEFAQRTGSMGRRTKGGERPASTTDSSWDEDAGVHFPKIGGFRSKTKAKFANDINNHRNDWAQQDDAASPKRMDKIGAYMRKKESIWILRGWREKSPNVETTSGSSGPSSPPDGNKTGRARFLARFMRHPN